MSLTRLTALVLTLAWLPTAAQANDPRTPLEWWQQWRNVQSPGGFGSAGQQPGTPVVTPMVVTPANGNGQARALTPQQRQELQRRLAEQNSALALVGQSLAGQQNSALKTTTKASTARPSALRAPLRKTVVWRAAVPASRLPSWH